MTSTNPADIARALSEYWMPIETADRNEKVPILVEFNHDADPYYNPADPNRLTDYAANAEGGDFLAGAGVTIAIWRGGYHESDGWESGNSYWMPDGWFAYLNGDASDYAVNATHWMPLPEFHRPTIDAGTDRNQAKVVRCGKEIE